MLTRSWNVSPLLAARRQRSRAEISSGLYAEILAHRVVLRRGTPDLDSARTAVEQVVNGGDAAVSRARGSSGHAQR